MDILQNNPLSKALITYKQETGVDNMTLAALCQTSSAQMSRYISGKHMPGISAFCVIIDALELNASELIKEFAEFYKIYGNHYRVNSRKELV